MYYYSGAMKRVDLIKKLKVLGYHLARKEGHDIYEKKVAELCKYLTIAK